MAGGHGARQSSRLGGLEARNNNRFGREECGEGGEAHWRDENGEDGPERGGKWGGERGTWLSAHFLSERGVEEKIVGERGTAWRF